MIDRPLVAPRAQYTTDSAKSFATQNTVSASDAMRLRSVKLNSLCDKLHVVNRDRINVRVSGLLDLEERLK